MLLIGSGRCRVGWGVILSRVRRIRRTWSVVAVVVMEEEVQVKIQ